MFNLKKLLFFGVVIMCVLHICNKITVDINIILLLILLITGVIAYYSDTERFGALNEEAISTLASMYEDGNLKVSNAEITGNLKVSNAEITGDLKVNGNIAGERYIYLRDHKNGDRQYIIGSGIGTNDEQVLGIHDSANYGTTFKVSNGRPVRFGDKFYFTADYLNNNKCGGHNLACTNSDGWNQNTFTIHSG